MARVDLRLVWIFLMVVAVAWGADNATTAAPKTAATTPAPPSRKPGILEAFETFISAVPLGIATTCATGAEAVKEFFTNPWW